MPLALLALALSLPAHAGDVFVSAAEARALHDAGATFLDARGALDQATAHIPGAAPLGWLSLRDTPGHDGHLTADLDYLGHPDAHILDGGLPAWRAAGGPVTTGAAALKEALLSEPTPGDFVPAPDPARRAGLAEVQAAWQSGGATLWDTREAREFTGETPYGEDRGGHIPGAVHLWYADLTRADGTLKPEDELRALLTAAGVSPAGTVIALCTGGVRSGFAYAVLRELGYPAVRNYDGSMWEWAATDLPLTSSD
jgi:thiosulfate/3-mercaptopyruvate sulfurtransferase